MTDPEHLGEALCAAERAEAVLQWFEAACPGDERPRQAIEAARAWASGELRVGAARAAAFAAHAAARTAPVGSAACAAARAAGHAAATAHVVTHALHAARYAERAAALAAQDP